jgi:ribonuclease III
MSWNEEHFRRQLETLQEQVEYTFEDDALLVQAMTHRSFANELGDSKLNNERLEFLGDAVLELVVSKALYGKYEQMAEGQMTRARAAIVRAESLAESAQRFNLGEILRLGRGEIGTGGQEKLSVLSAGVEALLGAIYVDGGYDPAERAVFKLLHERFDSPGELVALDPKSRLQEEMQRKHKGTPIYEVVDRSGPAHETQFVVEVMVGSRTLAKGEGTSRKAAETDAAAHALESLQK